MKLNLIRVLNDAWALFRGDSDLLIRIASVFMFIPQLALLLVVPPMPSIALTADMTETEQRALAQVLADWIAANGGWHLAATILVQFGTLVLLALYLRRDRPDVRTAMAGAVARFPRFLLAMILVGLPLGVGLFATLLLIPALYLVGRLMLTAPILAEASIGTPVGVRAAIARSWQLTKGNGLAVTGLASISVLGGVLLSAPFIMIDRALRANAPNPVAITMVDIGTAAAVAASLLAAILIQVATYRRLGAKDGI